MQDVNLWGLDIIGSVASLTRLALFSQGTHHSRMWGWYLGVVGLIAWGGVGFFVGSWAIMGMNIAYLVVNVRGWLRERRKAED